MRYAELMTEAHDAFIQGKPVKGQDLASQLRELGSPKYLYHATPIQNLPAIKQDGLRLEARSRRKAIFGEYPARIYFDIVGSKMVEKLQRHDAMVPGGVGAVDYAVLTIDPRQLSPDVRLFHDPEDSSAIYSETGFVPAHAIVAERKVSSHPRDRYYAVALHALQQAGITDLVGEDFAVDDNAILFYVHEPISATQLAIANRLIRAQGFDDVGIQNEFNAELGYGEVVGYLNDD